MAGRDLVVGQSPFIAKGPIDVVNYFTRDGSDGTAGEHRALLAGLLGVTLSDAALGFVIGVALSIIDLDRVRPVPADRVHVHADRDAAAHRAAARDGAR